MTIHTGDIDNNFAQSQPDSKAGGMVASILNAVKLGLIVPGDTDVRFLDFDCYSLTSACGGSNVIQQEDR